MRISFYQDPWGDKENSTFKGKDPNHDSISQLLLRIERGFYRIFGSGKRPKKSLIVVLSLLLLILWLCSGVYTVNPEENSVELVFGKYYQTSGPGLRYNFPYPIGSVKKVKVAQINKEEIGFSGGKSEGEGVMLTGDENIVNTNFEVQWRVKDPYNFLYKVNDRYQGFSVKGAAESAMRDSIGQSEIEFILRGEGRGKIALNTKDLLQSILDGYQMGVEVLSVQMKKVDPPEKVVNAFRDVQSARADKEREINQAYSYMNDILPRAGGDAQKITQSAEGYKSEVINRAKGDTKRFNKIYEQYKLAPHLTKDRLRLESIEDVYSESEKIIVDGGVSLPFLDVMEKSKK